MNEALGEQMHMPQYLGPDGGPAAQRRDPFYNVLNTMRTFFKGLANEPEWRDHQIVVFVDTNPAFTAYTQLALCECPTGEGSLLCGPGWRDLQLSMPDKYATASANRHL